MATELETAWAAGFFDGEGSVSIRHAQAKSRRVYTLYLHVAQVSREPLDQFARIFGAGNVRLVHSHDARRADYHDWCCNGASAGMILARMLPYLTVKRERALLGLEFQQRVEQPMGREITDGRRLTDGEMKIRLEYFQRMKSLNLRQVARAAAETKSENSQPFTAEGCDSPVCNDAKVAERGRNDHALRLVG